MDMEALSGIFRIGPNNLNRLNFYGVGLMLLGLLVVVLAKRAARRLSHPGWDLAIKLIGLLIAMAGTLVAMRIVG